MCPPFHDPSLIQDQDLVRVLDGGEPVCDHDGGAVLHQVDDGLLHQPLRLRIQ